MEINRKTTTKRYLRIAAVPEFDATMPDDFLKRLPCPKYLFDIDVKKTIKQMPISKILELQAIKKPNVIEIVATFFEVGRHGLMSLPIFDTMAIYKAINDHLLLIARMNGDIKINYKSEEVLAGVMSLDFGIFGVVDSYVRRMNITASTDDIERGMNQHEIVMQMIPAALIYQCLANDAQLNLYQRKLNEIYSKKH